MQGLRHALDVDANWQLLRGGRTNRVWRVSGRTGNYVLKLYRRGAETPLFPNDPRAEARALWHLQDSGLAPRPMLDGTDEQDPWVLYRHIDGHGGDAGPEQVGAALARLHRISPPPDLRHVATGSAGVLAQGDAMLRVCQDRAGLAALRPDLNVPPLPGADRVFLHGDPVAANMIRTLGGVCLIDWQCPACGDPAEDLAIALSPAMQQIYGCVNGSAAWADRVFAGYGNPAVKARYLALAPAFHWRMAVYCQWRMQHRAGDTRDAAALALEVDALRRAV